MRKPKKKPYKISEAQNRNVQRDTVVGGDEKSALLTINIGLASSGSSQIIAESNQPVDEKAVLLNGLKKSSSSKIIGSNQPVSNASVS
jgi:hypothetical protein